MDTRCVTAAFLVSVERSPYSGLAYRRAIGVVLYVNARLAYATGCWPFGSKAYACLLACLLARLAPRKDFGAGNTFVFV